MQAILFLKTPYIARQVGLLPSVPDDLKEIHVPYLRSIAEHQVLVAHCGRSALLGENTYSFRYMDPVSGAAVFIYEQPATEHEAGN